MFRKTILSTVAVALLATAGLSAMTSAASAQKIPVPVSAVHDAAIQVAASGQSAKAIDLHFTIASALEARLNTMQWTMVAGSEGRPILSGNQYRLFNAVAKAGLTRQVRVIAANLGWLASNSKEFNVRIKRKAGDGQVRYGDVVALQVKSYGWLRYKEQSAGINLSDDDNNPHYMWIVTGGPKGTKLYSGMPFALYNTVEKTEMTYCVRANGINLGWYGKSSCNNFFDKLSNVVFGENGLFAMDGLTGKAAKLLKDHLCKVAVTSLAAGIVGTSGGAASAAALAIPIAIEECKAL